MGLRVNQNLAAMHALHGLARVEDLLGRSFRRLSTGLRIATAADDAAGLAISERLRAQIRSLDQASRNAGDGISLVQTAEGSLAEANSILGRLRELAMQSANGTTSASDRDTLNSEFGALVDELDRIGHGAAYSGISLLDGSASQVTFQVDIGTVAGIDTIDVALSPALATTLNLDTLDIGSAGNTSLALTNIDAAIQTVSALRGRLGAAQNRLSTVIAGLSARSEGLQAAESRIRDVDVAYETALQTRLLVLRQVGIAVLAHATALPHAALSLLGGKS